MDTVLKKLRLQSFRLRQCSALSRYVGRPIAAIGRAVTSGVGAVLMFGFAALVIAFAAIWFGFVGIAAGAAASPATKLVLDFALERYVARESHGIDAPKLDSLERVVRGAEHYRTSCEACHRAPGVQRARLASALDPAPVDLSLQGPRWTAAELFWITKHGIPLSGMPAWGRLYTDDEIWQLVSIVERLPQMSAQDYSELRVAAPAEGGSDGVDRADYREDQSHR